ncbi:MAG TPA: hypothetical protein VMS71_06655, partial [Candidatus Acidoferrum sp.]|nr:hypothetical protein [Candidatus Acidoferrum sp.]
MPLIEILWPSAIAVLALMLAGHSSGGSKPPSPLPIKLQYSFGSNSLVRDSEYIAVVSTLTWDNAQVPPPAGFEAAPCARLISLEDFTKLWQQLNLIDLAPVTNPGDDEFEHTPPDMSHVETLRLIVDGKIMIDWAKPDYQLKAEVRKPLDAFNDSLESMWKLRSKELVIPNALDLSLSSEGKATYRVRWIKGSVSELFSDSANGTAKLPSNQFEALWSNLVTMNTLCGSYTSTESKVPGKAA